LERNAKVVIVSHNGRPKGVEPALSMSRIAIYLGHALAKQVMKLNDCVGPDVSSAVKAMRPGDIILLENARFHEEEEADDETFAKALARLADVYVDDAFANCHRAHASMVGVPRYIPSCVGLLVEQELSALSKVATDPARPFVVILGGAKSDKLDLFKSLMPKVDALLTGGVLANTFLKVAGAQVGQSKVSKDAEPLVRSLKGDSRVKVPVDVVVASKFEAGAKTKVLQVGKPCDGFIVDLGPKTIEQYIGVLKSAKTIFWAGPIGVFEIDAFAQGSKRLAEVVASLSSLRVIGGGDSAAAAQKFGVADRFDLVSTGGGASIMMVSGQPLVAVQAIENSRFPVDVPDEPLAVVASVVEAGARAKNKGSKPLHLRKAKKVVKSVVEPRGSIRKESQARPKRSSVVKRSKSRR
ncbi:MAG: phosphoglycerate kinase, partial [Nanoarchaeota archaeon]